MKSLSLLFVLSLVISIMSCSKPANTNNDHTSVLYTDTSTNYLRCTINGNPWHSTADSMSAHWTNSYKTLSISARDYSLGTDVEVISFNIVSGDTLVPGVTGFNGGTAGASYYSLFPTNDTLIYSTDDSGHIGSAYIGFDMINSRVVGLFSFTGKSKKKGTTIYISDGSFSMPFVTH